MTLQLLETKRKILIAASEKRSLAKELQLPTAEFASAITDTIKAEKNILKENSYTPRIVYLVNYLSKNEDIKRF